VAMKILRIHLEKWHERIVDTIAERDNVGKAEAIRRMIANHDIEKDLALADGQRHPKRCTGIHLDERHFAVIETISRRYGISKGEAARRIIGCYQVVLQAPPPPPPLSVTLTMGAAAAH